MWELFLLLVFCDACICSHGRVEWKDGLVVVVWTPSLPFLCAFSGLSVVNAKSVRNFTK